MSVARLQIDIRALFSELPNHRAFAASLGHLGSYLGGNYAVAHAALGPTMLTEEWYDDTGEPDEALREMVTTTMWEAMSSGTARCARVRLGASDPVALIAGLIYDEDYQQAGAAALAGSAAGTRRCTRYGDDRARAVGAVNQ